jgi:translation initiation factor 2 beta subunit (eIF-2beta)/eIF-5
MIPETNAGDAAKSCKHPRTRVIAKDNDAQYLECLDCGAIVEAGELKENSGFGESLSDA